MEMGLLTSPVPPAAEADRAARLRLAILRVFEVHRAPGGFGVGGARHLAGWFGFVFPGAEPAAEAIEYLAARGWIAPVPGSKAAAWRITGAGVRFLAALFT